MTGGRRGAIRKKQKRRSQRVALKIPVHVEYFVNDSGRLSCDSGTVKVSAHGELLRLPWGVPVGRLRSKLRPLVQRPQLNLINS
jgi:hypothetical protein